MTYIVTIDAPALNERGWNRLMDHANDIDMAAVINDAVVDALDTLPAVLRECVTVTVR